MHIFDFKELINQQGVYLAVLIVSVAGGLIPVLSIELLLLLIAPFLHSNKIIIVVTIASVGQILPKIIVFYTGMGASTFIKEEWKKRITDLKEKIKNFKYGTDAFVFLSSFTGFPPFYLVSIAAGAVRYRVENFIIFGGIGRFLRFLLILLFPKVLKDIIS